MTDGENEIYVENGFHYRCLKIPVRRYSNNFEFFQALKELFTSEIKLGIHIHFMERTGHIVFDTTKGSVFKWKTCPTNWL